MPKKPNESAASPCSAMTLLQFLGLANCVYVTSPSSEALQQLARGHSPSCTAERRREVAETDERCCDPFEGVAETTVIDLVRMSLPALLRVEGPIGDDASKILADCAAWIADRLEVHETVAGKQP